MGGKFNSIFTSLLRPAVNFGELYWSWQACSPGLSGTNYRGVYGIDADTGEKFLPRIWAGLEPEATAEDVLTAKAEALGALAAMPHVAESGRRPSAAAS